MEQGQEAHGDDCILPEGITVAPANHLNRGVPADKDGCLTASDTGGVRTALWLD